MFIPKPALFILFLVAIVSTGGLLYLLSQRTQSTAVTPKATNTVMVSASVVPSPLQSNQPSSSSAELSASAEWKNYSSSSLSVKLDYPVNWSVSATESGVLRVTPAASQSGTSVVVTIQREKKARSSAVLSTFTSQRLEQYKKDGYESKDEKSYSINDYAGIERYYTKEESTIREIAFATKNYYYYITISPGKSSYTAIVDELLKSVAII